LKQSIIYTAKADKTVAKENPLQQGLKLGSGTTGVASKNVAKENPLQQGLKLISVTYTATVFVGRKGKSTTTRIETLHSFRTGRLPTKSQRKIHYNKD